MPAICLGRNHQHPPLAVGFPNRGGVGFTPDALRKTIGMLKKVGQFFPVLETMTGSPCFFPGM